MTRGHVQRLTPAVSERDIGAKDSLAQLAALDKNAIAIADMSGVRARTGLR